MDVEMEQPTQMDPQAIFKAEFERLCATGLPPQEAAVRALTFLKQKQDNAQSPATAEGAGNSEGGGDNCGDDNGREEETAPANTPVQTPAQTPAPAPASSSSSTAVMEDTNISPSNPAPLDTETFIRMSEALKKEVPTCTDPPEAKKAKTSPHKDYVPKPPASGALTKMAFLEMLEKGATNADGNYYRVIVRKLGTVFSDCRNMNWCFLNDPEDIRNGLDLDAARETLITLTATGGVGDDGKEDSTIFKHQPVANAMQNAFKSLFANFHSYRNDSGPERVYDAHTILTLFEHPLLTDPEYQKSMTSPLCLEAFHLFDMGEENGRLLFKHWSRVSLERFERLLGVLQQFVTCRLLDRSTNTDEIFAAVRVMDILYRINEDRKLVDVSEFNNDIVNNPEILDLRQDFRRWMANLRQREQHAESGSSSASPRVGLSDTSLCDYPFILDPGSKAYILKLHAQAQMQSEVRSALFTRRHVGGRSIPYLYLKVRRTHLIEDTLQQIVGMPASEFKKPLKIKFDGEEGVDEGGVQKEFFLLIIRQLFDPMYGMFLYDEDQRTFWFNGNCFENNLQFALIGNLMGVAIYNSVILDVKFPTVVYDKLMGIEPTLAHLKAFNPALAKGLQSMLDLDPEQVEEVFSETNFSVTVEAFGEKKEVPLKEGGDAINVTKDNREEYVALYVAHILTTSIKHQFDAFKKGFLDVCDGDALRLFRPEELELLICGSPTLDFDELEEGAHYDDGFDEENLTIKHFWEVVHGFNDENKKKFLQFCTGTDRVPIRGLGNLRFVISKNGPDSDLLPTSHTCFNHLLLPEYNNLEKMREKLLIAINHSEGFGTI